jgi:glycine/sarcosine N-methyltransferase
VIDVACGTGHHAAMLHSWGLRVEGADLNAAMIDRARSTFGQRPDLNWSVRAFDETIPVSEPFDAAICVGNSLPLASDREVVDSAIRQMLAAVRDGGIVVVQLLNLWRLPDGATVWQKCQRATLPVFSPAAADVLIVKGVRRCGTRGYVELLIADLAGQSPMRSESPQLLGLESSELAEAAKRGGAARVEFFGGYQDQPFDRQQSADLLMIAGKGG